MNYFRGRDIVVDFTEEERVRERPNMILDKNTEDTGELS